ncbi:hypothetical protein [Thorsellia anophelis]|uniref:hypothetical protein n=1 Tax=Thorsellia anophelis TaxID=336804 RepID=UPI00115FCA90|nr:hypothetical protein [Thorsellia anophelis]
MQTSNNKLVSILKLLRVTGVDIIPIVILWVLSNAKTYILISIEYMHEQKANLIMVKQHSNIA